jgi:hypothetical protein
VLFWFWREIGFGFTYYPYLATGATLGKEQEAKVRLKKILRVIAKKKLLFFAQHTAGIESTQSKVKSSSLTARTQLQYGSP